MKPTRLRRSRFARESGIAIPRFTDGSLIDVLTT